MPSASTSAAQLFIVLLQSANRLKMLDLHHNNLFDAHLDEVFEERVHQPKLQILIAGALAILRIEFRRVVCRNRNIV